MQRNKNLVINIAADGIQSAVIFDVTKTPEEYRELAEAYVRTYLEGTSVGRMIFNVSYKRSITDSDVFDSVLYNVALDENGCVRRDETGASIKTECPPATGTNMLNNYRIMMQRGIDVIEMLIDATRSYGAEAWLSVRMNDHHFANDPGFNSMLSYSRADELGVNGSRVCMDYSKEPVRNYYMGYLVELSKRYRIDGIELDFLRSAPLLSDPGPAGQALLNGFIRDVRANIDDSVSLCARVFSTPEHNDSYGIDPAQWIADGALSFLTVSGWYIPTYFSIPVGLWRERINSRNTAGHPCPLLVGTDWGVRCYSQKGKGNLIWLTLEQLKGFASSAYERGADGVYFFNHFCTDDYHGAICYYLDENGALVPKNVLRDKLLAADSAEASEQGERCYVHTCRDYENELYPIPIGDGASYTAQINTGTRFDRGTYSVILGLDEGSAAPEVFINGTAANKPFVMPRPRFEDGMAFEGTSPVAKHVSVVAPLVLQYDLADLSALRSGDNELHIAGGKASVLWLEIHACKA